jgi:uncharacterized protein (TIGR00369 family)
MFDDPDAGRSVARYLGLTLQEVPGTAEGTARVVGTAPAPDYLRDADGTIAAGALLALADSVAGLCGGLAALPGWVVSTNLMLHVVRGDAAGPLELRADVLRAGRKAVVSAVTVHDAGADDRLLADGILTSAVLVPEGGPPLYARPLRLEAPPIDPRRAPHLTEYVGVRTVDATTVAIDVADELRNPWGILHGGVTAVLVDLAARHATGGPATTDAVVHFLAPGRVGPVTAHVRPVGVRPDGALVRVEVRDQGAGDRVMAIAVTTVAV